MYQQIYSQSVTLAPGNNTISLSGAAAPPAGTSCLGVMITGATTSATTQAVLAVSNATLGMQSQYTRAQIGATAGRFPTVYVDATSGNTSLQINNQSANNVTATVTVVAFGFTSKQMQSNPNYVEKYAWMGWSDSNINVFSTTPSAVNCVMGVTADMMLLGMEVDFTASVGNDVTTHFAEVLYLHGFNRGYYANPAFPTSNSNNANPTTSNTAPGFGAITTDTAVNWGPNTAPYPDTLSAVITKGSDSSIANGQSQHVSLDLHDSPLLLKSGDSLWWHIAGQTEGSATTTQINGEVQSIIRYALL